MLEKMQIETQGDVIGADVSKDKIDICFLNEARHETIKNTDTDIKKWIKKLKGKNIKIIAMEYTGGYEATLRQWLGVADIPTHVAHPKKIYHFSKQKGYFAKTDKIDANIIAQFAEQESVLTMPMPSQVDVELNELSSRRSQLVNALIAEKNRLKPHLSSQTKRSIKRMIKQLETEIKLIENKIKDRIENDEKKQATCQRLQTFKGVGETVAIGLVSGLSELGTLTRTGIAALLGVAPKTHDSGRKSGKRIIQGGRFDVRKLVYMAALSAIRHNHEMKKCYERLKEKGKPSKVALVAVMRKIIVTLNAMIRDGVDYKQACSI